MNFKSNMNKILFRILRMIPGADHKALLKQYVKIKEAAPELAPEAWELLWKNWRWQKRNRQYCRIVSLGYDCMVRTYTTIYMLKRGKKSGEKSLPFDLAITPPEMVAHFLQNDFEDYFADGWYYDPVNKWWNNVPGRGIFYPHDTDCGPQDLAKLQSRLKKRIDNFRETLDFSGMLFFIAHKTAGSSADDFQKIYSSIAEKRGGKPFKMLVLASDHDEKCRDINFAGYVYKPYPRSDYIWHLSEMRYTSSGISYEMSIAESCYLFVTGNLLK